MKRFRERNKVATGAVTIVVIAALIVFALNFAKLPLVSSKATYHADFANAGDLVVGNIVTVAGVHEGLITKLALDGNKVRVTFTTSPGLHLGLDTGARAKVLTPIGQEYLELTPAGPGRLTANTIIPVSRTSIPSTLVGDLSTLGSQTQKYNLNNLAKAFSAIGQTLGAAPASATTAALSGLASFSEVLAGRQQQLQTLITQGAQLTGVLNQRSGELVNLVGQGDLVLQVLNQRRSAIQALLATTSNLSSDLSAILVGDRAQIGTLLSSLQTVSALLSQDSTTITNTIPVLAAFDRYTANVTGSGNFADVVIPTMLIPDNIIVQCEKQAPLNPTLGCQA